MALEIAHLKTALGLRLQAYTTMSSTKIYRDRRFRFLTTLVALSLIGFVIMPRDKSDADASIVVPTPPVIDTPKIDISRFDLALEDSQKPAPIIKSVKIKSGDSLGPLLQKNGLSGPEAYRITQAFSTVYKPKNVRVDQIFTLYFEDDTLTNLTYKPSVDQTIFVKKTGETYTAKSVDAEFKMDLLTVKASIENSLYLDASRLGAPDRVIQQFANIYEYSVDFQRDIQPGDEFEMFFEIARDHNGHIIKSGDLLYTSFSPRGKTSAYYLYQDTNGQENFYDIKGKTAKRKLRATPVNGARLSSRFGKRRHPILGYRKMHTGVDFAAPRGTPILAAGAGTVKRANRYGGYGNYIRIKHSDGYETAYAHLKNFARGIRAGARVRQDQVIGYVGTTGRSTGPHLHYEVILNGRKINPRRLSQLSGKPLAKNQIEGFKKRRAEIDALRLSSPVKTPTLAELNAEADPQTTVEAPLETPQNIPISNTAPMSNAKNGTPKDQ